MKLKNLVKISTALAVTAVALVVPSAASAANVIPNPGFEADCGGVPCSWIGVDGVTTRDTVNPKTGAASIKLTIGGGAGPHQATAHTVCTNATVQSGIRQVSFAYRATAGVTGLAMTVSLFANAGCTGGIAQVPFDVNSVNTTNTWQVVNAGINVPSTAQSFQINLGTGCASGCNGTQATNFDDVVLDQAATAATLVSFRGQHTAKGVRLTWQTAATPQLAGFNVYRGTKKLNRTIVRSVRGTLAASTFSWLDRTAARSGRPLTYRLQAVYLDGTRAWLGSTRV